MTRGQVRTIMRVSQVTKCDSFAPQSFETHHYFIRSTINNMNALFDPVAFDDNVNNIISNMNTVNFDPVVDNNVTLVKPMRPLTAYHIFFQLEREYIIQTSDGEIANKSSLDNKIYLDDVPERYKNIRLLRDWYAGPGKRKKRKHRKQHGKIGFLELSRIISTRWAELDMVNPETKIFVQKIAKSEIDEYYREMKQYKELTKDIKEDDDNITSNVAPKKKSAEKRSRMVSIICHDVKTDNNNIEYEHHLKGSFTTR